MHEQEHLEERGAWVRLAFAAAFWLTGLATGAYPTVSLLCYGLAALSAAVPVFWGALRELRHTVFGEQTLLLVAVLAAFVIGEGAEGAAVAVLFALGEQLEDRAVERSHRTVEALAEIRPDTAFVRTAAGELVEISAASVAAGDLLEIPPHHRVPVDCVVVEGTSAVSLAALTGESTPVAAMAGTELLSGGMNGDAPLCVRALRPAAQSAAARILAQVEDAAARGGKTEKFITRFARVYTPVVTGAAVLTAAVPALAGWLPLAESVHRALTFLVAACPCALVLSVPLGFTAGMGAASKRGVLIKGGRYLEALATARAVAFDKTGTLTTARAQVTALTTDGVSREQALSLALALEQGSEHPLAVAVADYARAAGATPAPLTERTELPAQGITGIADGVAVAIGGRRVLPADSAPPAGDVWLTRDGRVVAAFTVEAPLRPDAKSTVEALRKLGVKHIEILTGDREIPAKAVAKQVGADGVRFGLLPEQKQQRVAALGAQYGGVVFVGDGINDAPVLAQASVGVAMGNGSAAAIETGDAVLMGGLSALPAVIRLSRRVLRTTRQNVVFALAVKAAVLALAVCGFAPVWLAVFADVGVTCLCVLHASKILLTRP